MPVDIERLLDESFARGLVGAEDRDRIARWIETVRAADPEATRLERPLPASGPGPSDMAGAAPSRYEMREVLGAGGMGEVRLAFDPALEREVAIKVVKDRANPEIARSFLEEARVTGKLEHPNIVPVHELEASEERGGPYLVMRRIKGRTLREVLDRVRAGRSTGLALEAEEDATRGGGSSRRGRGQSSARLRAYRARAEREAEGTESPQRVLSRLLDLFLKITDGVAYAHSMGVIHRDLKPDNVMTAEFGQVLVLDWGLAKTRNAELGTRNSGRRSETETDRTREGEVIGTPVYMSPEQARGELDRIDHRTDVYGLGAILYEIVSLARPIEAKTGEMAIVLAGKGEIEPPSSRSRAPWAIPRELEAVVMKAMAFDPNDRYRSVAGLAGDIEAYRAGRVLAAAEYSQWQLVAKWARRNKALVYGGGSTVAALLAGLVAVVWVVARADAEKLREGERVRVVEEGRRALEAEKGYASALDRREAADAIPLNPASPEEYFRAHVGALSALGESLARHPDPAAAWRKNVASYAERLQRDAESTGDWPLAQILAESPAGWGAVGPDERDSRLAEVERAFAETAARDEARLEELLDRVEGAGTDEKHGRLLEGELEERARRLAARSGPALGNYALARILGVAPRGVPATSRGRIALVEVLGRKGNPHASSGGVDLPSVIRRALELAAEEADSRKADETAAWIVAGGRLVARSPGALSGFAELVERVVAAHESVGPVAVAAARSRELAAGPGPLEEHSEAVAVTRRSGAAYTRLLLGRAIEALDRGRWRTLAILAEQIGLAADRAPPDPEERGRAAVPVLRRIFDRAREEAAQEAAIAAAIALSRLEDDAFGPLLLSCRHATGEYSVFWTRTRVANALLDVPTRSLGRDLTTAADFMARAFARADRGDLAGAVADYTLALELDPKHVRARVNRANARADLGDLAGAVEDYTRALEIDPTNAPAYTNRGTARHEQGDLAGALADHSRAIELDPEEPSAYSNRGNVRHDQWDLAGAVADHSRAIELAPDFGVAYLNRGVARFDQGDLQGAIADLSVAIELDPHDATAYSRRALARRERGDLEGAVADSSLAIQIDPDNSAAYNCRGGARVLQGDLAGAVADCAIAVEIDPMFWQAWTNLGLPLARLGRREEAARAFERALEVAPDSMRQRVEAARRAALGG